MEPSSSQTVTQDQLHVYYFYTPGVKTGTHKKTGERYTQRIMRWTHCFVHDDNGRYGRGSSLCSISDNPVRAKGRSIAFKRAVHGYFSQKITQGQLPDGSTMYKSMGGHPLSRLEGKFMDNWRKAQAKAQAVSQAVSQDTKKCVCGQKCVDNQQQNCAQ